jgi:DNA-binding GntR family transcriptional regulator
MAPDRDPMPTAPGVPRYLELANLLRARMDAKRPKEGYRSGDKFPTEPDLMTESGYSRETVRTSLRILRSERRIRVAVGVGTFVTAPSQWREAP